MDRFKHSSYFLLWLVMCSLLLSGCDLRSKPAMVSEQPIDAPPQPFRIVQVCLDTPPLYAERYFRAAANAIADRIVASIAPNFGGMVVYVTRISSNSFEDEPLSFAIPAFGPDPQKPQPPQTHGGFGDAEAKAAYQDQLAQWQRDLVDHHRKLTELRRWVAQQATKLRTLSDPYDQAGSDIWGCLATASMHFQQQAQGERYLLIASAMVNTTTLQQTQSLSLSGVTVEVMWRPCQVAVSCQASDGQWRQVFQRAGARQVWFRDPAESDVIKPQF